MPWNKNFWSLRVDFILVKHNQHIVKLHLPARRHDWKDDPSLHANFSSWFSGFCLKFIRFSQNKTNHTLQNIILVMCNDNYLPPIASNSVKLGLAEIFCISFPLILDYVLDIDLHPMSVGLRCHVHNLHEMDTNLDTVLDTDLHSMCDCLRYDESMIVHNLNVSP